jgi:hypothetical protein
MNSMARRMFELVEPIGVIPYSADEPNEAMFALGFTNYWDTYFAGRAAPLGQAPAEVVDALFYNFAPGEGARHIPKVWRTTTPEAAIAARQMGCAKALRWILCDHVDSPAFARGADLLLKAATSAPFEGRPMYAALRALPIPDDVVARLFHAASLLREHRGDGHIAALMIEGVGPRGSRPLRPRHGHARGEVRTHPPPRRSPTRASSPASSMKSWPRSNRSPRNSSPPKTGRRDSHDPVRAVIGRLPPTADGTEQTQRRSRPVAPAKGKRCPNQRAGPSNPAAFETSRACERQALSEPAGGPAELEAGCHCRTPPAAPRRQPRTHPPARMRRRVRRTCPRTPDPGASARGRLQCVSGRPVKHPGETDLSSTSQSRT